MNESGSRKVRDWGLQKPVPGCLGRMINIFELSAGMAGTKMLTDRAHRDGSVCGTQPYVAKKGLDPVAGQIENKPVTYELKKNSSNKRSSGTPMKMLIAQEMSKETDSKQKPPSVVARLMGLDGLPVRQQVPALQGAISDPYKHSAPPHDMHLTQVSGGTLGYEVQENRYFNMSVCHDMHPSQLHFSDKKEYKDVYEVWPQQSRASHFREQSLTKGRYNEKLNEKRMALVRQKFIEAKRLVTDQKLLQSKEFQEALDVLSSNRDLFLKALEEPNSLFSKHLQELQTVSTAPQTKHITLLKPSKSVDSRHDNEMRERQKTVEYDQFDSNKPIRSSGFACPKAENLPQPTRIVVLKPSPRKPQDLKDGANSSAFCTGLLDDRYIFEELGADETSGSREVAKEITRCMRESLSSNRRDDTLLSSVLSNGYIGDESSFNRSENEFMEDDGGNFSDSDIVSPSSRQSWDNINRFSSPFSLSSLSRASYSPESSVIREAKKWLSERWAMVASNGTNQEQIQVRRSSSTLGEMLAIPETKKEEGNEVEFTLSSSLSYSGEQGVRLPVASSCVNRHEDGRSGADSPRNLLRSRSVPATSSAYDDIRLNVEASGSQVDKAIASKDSIKLKSGKSSLKVKVSSLFFSRNKKSNVEKSEPSSLVGTSNRVEAVNLDCTSKNNDIFSYCSPTDMRGGSQNSEELIFGSSSPAASENGVKPAASSTKAATSLAQVRRAESARENQDQPSPISVLEAPFEEDGNSSSSRSSEIANLECRQLISRSPPIESVARSLSWDECRPATGHLKLSKLLSKADRGKDNYALVKSLLSSAGLDDQKSSTAVVGWYSLESPLDPSLLDKFLERKEEDAKCRERRSNQRLLFDSVNAALLDISRSAILEASRVNVTKNGGVTADASLTEKVWVRVKNWFHGEEQQFVDQGENSSLSLDRVLKNEVAGSGWMEMLSSEVGQVGKEIEGELLKELVGEALADLIPG